MRPDEPTDEMPGGAEQPTEVNSPGDEPTGRIPAGDENPTGVLPEGNDEETGVLDEGSDEPTEVRNQPGPAGNGPAWPAAAPTSSGGNRGIGVLIAAILASLALAGAYLVAGGPVGPDGAADPCDPRPWTDPGNVEEAAQQFALSAADGAACALGVSREELTRSIADDQTRQEFMEEHGFTDTELEEALRAGLNRAVDDAENAGALDGLAASGVRLAIKVMPMSVMIGLLENADGIFNGDFGSLGGVTDAIDAITGGIEGLDSGTTDDAFGGLQEAIEGALPEGTTDELERLIPEETRQELEGKAREKLKQGLNELIGP